MAIAIVLVLLLILQIARERLFLNYMYLTRRFRISPTSAIWSYSLLFLPGTVVHELSHFLLAAILGLKTGSIDLLPRIEKNSIKFGTVEVQRKDPIRSLLVGIAPTISGLLILWLLTYFVEKIPLSLLIYAMISIASHMLPSRDDLVYLVPFMLFLIIAVAFWWYIHSQSLFFCINGLNNSLTALITPLSIASGIVTLGWLIVWILRKL